MHTFRVMTFNIRGSVVDDGDNSWEFRSKLNIDTIRKYVPDIIGFQEMQEGNWADYQEHLPDYERLRGPKYGSEPFCYPSIFWDPERYEIIEHGQFWLSETPEKHSSSWNTRCIRSAAWIRFRIKSLENTAFIFLNTHLDHVSEQARIEGARLIIRMVETITTEGQPVIITADFNCNPGSDTYEAFLDSGYADTFLSSGNKDDKNAFTFHEFKGVRHSEYARIDWILTRSESALIRSEKVIIIRDADEPVYPSDHYPVTADLVMSYK